MGPTCNETYFYRRNLGRKNILENLVRILCLLCPRCENMVRNLGIFGAHGRPVVFFIRWYFLIQCTQYWDPFDQIFKSSYEGLVRGPQKAGQNLPFWDPILGLFPRGWWISSGVGTLSLISLISIEFSHVAFRQAKYFARPTYWVWMDFRSDSTHAKPKTKIC